MKCCIIIICNTFLCIRHLSSTDFEFVEKLYKEGAEKYEENLAKYKELYQTYQLRSDDVSRRNERMILKFEQNH